MSEANASRTSRKLPLIAARRAELETCAYCPKLCRAACPVSEAEWSETVTPWGKMSSVFVTLGAAEQSGAHVTPQAAALAWACTGCLACRERCDHRNPVRDTLFEARATYQQAGLAPAAAERVQKGFQAQMVLVSAGLEELRRAADMPLVTGGTSGSVTELLLGCSYVAREPASARAALRAAQNLFGPVRLVSGCCGLALEQAGDAEGARRVRQDLLSSLAPGARRVALDAGCTYALRDAGFTPFSRAALEVISERAPLASAPTWKGGALRYHDPCLLGRGLGEYEAPRTLLRRALGAEPFEFERQREFGACSGGGGLLPLTRPETARAIADDRVSEHIRQGGGKIVTACAQSLRSLRKAGAEVVDLAEIVLSLSEK